MDEWDHGQNTAYEGWDGKDSSLKSRKAAIKSPPIEREVKIVEFTEQHEHVRHVTRIGRLPLSQQRAREGQRLLERQLRRAQVAAAHLPLASGA